MLAWEGSHVREVVARIRFLSPCLGNARRKTGQGILYSMMRDLDGRVIFLPTWWNAISRFASRVQNRHQEAVSRIHWNVTVDGSPGKFKRFLTKTKSNGQQRYALHEAFLTGCEIRISCVLPSEITVEDFRELLSVAGRYRGISPFKPDTYGRFEVVDATLASSQ